MNRNAGVWIDHRRAVIVSLVGEGEEIRELPSNMEKHIRFSGGGQDGPGDDHRDKRFTGHLNKYYDMVVSHLRDAGSIVILGPGEAKGELEKRLRAELPGARIDALETTDKMTHNKIAEKVREHFLSTTGEAQHTKETKNISTYSGKSKKKA
jgi:stalled ribosome rescue protein Dom34